MKSGIDLWQIALWTETSNILYFAEMHQERNNLKKFTTESIQLM